MSALSDLPSLVVFDLAGTTIVDDGQVPAAFAAAAAHHGAHVTPQQVENVRGASKREAFGKLLPNADDHPDRVEAAYRSFQQDLARRFTVNPPRAVAGAVTTFAWLRSRSIRVALNTGFDRATTELLLAPLGWLDGVADAVVCVDDVAHGRPAPDLILCAMARTGVADPERVANVGDTTLDLEAAQNAGVRWNIGVLSGAHGRERMQTRPHTHLVADVGELPNLWSAL